MTRKDIRISLKTPFGDSVIKRILLENGCIIKTNPGAQKGGRKKQEINVADQQKIIDLYNQGYGMNYIAQQMNGLWSGDKVKRVLKDNNIKLRDFYEAITVKPDDEVDLRKYQINDDYVFESHNGAWLLGFLAADGYLPDTKGAKNRVVLSLARKDEEVLYRIKEELEYTGPIYQYVINGSLASSLTFNSKKIRNNLEKYGIVNNKTFNLKSLPYNLPQEYMIDYIRGYFDGDGCIQGGNGKKVYMSLVSANKEFLEDLSTYLYKTYDLPLAKICKDHNAFDIVYYKKSTLFLGNLFYNHNYLALKRKQEHYFQILNETQRKQLPRD